MVSVPLDSAIRQLMANTHQSSNSSADNAKKSFVIDGKRFVKTNVHRIQYRFCEAAADNHRLGKSSLVDRGDNGGLAGEDICVIEHTLRKADIIGINDHTVVGLPIVTAAGLVQTLAGPVCLILHQYALIGKGKSIHSSVQMECYDILVDERSRKLRKGGQQCLTTVEGIRFPFISDMVFRTWTCIHLRIMKLVCYHMLPLLWTRIGILPRLTMRSKPMMFGSMLLNHNPLEPKATAILSLTNLITTTAL